MKQFTIQRLDSLLAESHCRHITASLPEWFGLAEANETYAQGVKSRLCFGAFEQQQCIGLLALEFPSPHNANIYWLGVHQASRSTGAGSALMNAAKLYCLDQGYQSITVETLSLKQNDPHYFETYQFYQKHGFKPLFEMHTHDRNNLMVYMQTQISLPPCQYHDLTHTLNPDVPHWNGTCGFEHTIEPSCEGCTDPTIRVMKIAMQAGIGTHIDAPNHFFENQLDVSSLLLKDLITPCIVLDVSQSAHATYSVEPETILSFEKIYGKIPSNSLVIIRTGWDKYWHDTKAYRNDLIFPSVSMAAGELLLERKVAGLGIDTLSPDRGDSQFPIHKMFLGENKYLLENLANTHTLPARGAMTFALPMKVEAGTEAPVRVVAVTL